MVIGRRAVEDWLDKRQHKFDLGLQVALAHLLKLQFPAPRRPFCLPAILTVATEQVAEWGEIDASMLSNLNCRLPYLPGLELESLRRTSMATRRGPLDRGIAVESSMSRAGCDPGRLSQFLKASMPVSYPALARRRKASTMDRSAE